MEPNFTDALVITGGGTGGHYYPAIAIAEAAQLRWPGRQILFIGAKRGIEGRKLPETQWPYLLLDVEGLHGKSPIRLLRSAWRMYRAIKLLKKIWINQRPWAVIGTGGYGSGPALFAAGKLGVPYFIHESNAEPGLAVKMAAGKAERIWLGIKAAAARLPKAQCLYVGTPIREPFQRPFKPYSELQQPHMLLVLGGSGGARAINNAMLSIGDALLEKHHGWEIFHQTGIDEMERLKGSPRHSRHLLTPYIENMDATMENASLVLTRAGASTCSELRAAGRPAVFVPFPASAGGHQKSNALALAEEGRGIVVEQGQSFEDRLFAALSKLMEDDRAREALSKPEPNDASSKCLDDLCNLFGTS
jgi:UDP-N-acetylglucosamine--N-acetylmuramyl-(pentapeptide) pyrophosphoryl-undecaprenol N-acetylglucosamine transferase